MAPKKKPSKTTGKTRGKAKPTVLAAAGNASLAIAPSTLSTRPGHEASQLPASRLLQLPLELREKIYTLLLDVRYTRCTTGSVRYAATVENDMLRLKTHTLPFAICTSLLRVNKQMHKESMNLLYASNLFVRLSLYTDDIYWTEALLEGTSLGFISTNPISLDKLTRQALDVKIINEGSKKLRFQGVLSHLYIPRFVHHLQAISSAIPRWGNEHEFHLCLRHRYKAGPGADEKILLEPWRMLHGIKNVVIGTDVAPPAYATDLRSTMMGQRFEPWAWVETLRRIKETGAADFKKGAPSSAYKSFFSTIEILTAVYDGGLAPQLISMPIDFDQAINRLRFQLELNVVLCVTKMRDKWERGVTAADRALSLTEEGGVERVWRSSAPNVPRNDVAWYTDLDRAKAMFRRGGLMMAVGECAFAAEQFMEAKALSPGDATIADAYEKASRMVDANVQPGSILSALGIVGT